VTCDVKVKINLIILYFGLFVNDFILKLKIKNKEEENSNKEAGDFKAQLVKM
jgi:hypothetical protein